MVTTRQSTKAAALKEPPNNGDGSNDGTHDKLPSKDRFEREGPEEENGESGGGDETEIAHILLAARNGGNVQESEFDEDTIKEGNVDDLYAQQCDVVVKHNSVYKSECDNIDDGAVPDGAISSSIQKLEDNVAKLKDKNSH